MEIHKSITKKRIMDLAENNNIHCMNMGVCLACGEERDSCEPDARDYECWYCEKRQVQGWMAIFERGLWHSDKPELHKTFFDVIPPTKNEMEFDKRGFAKNTEAGKEQEDDEFGKMSLDEQADAFHDMLMENEKKHEENKDV